VPDGKSKLAIVGIIAEGVIQGARHSGQDWAPVAGTPSYAVRCAEGAIRSRLPNDW